MCPNHVAINSFFGYFFLYILYYIVQSREAYCLYFTVIRYNNIIIIYIYIELLCIRHEGRDNYALSVRELYIL